MRAKIFKGLKWLGIALISIVLVIVIAFQVSPRPGAFVIAHLFNDATAITNKKEYDHAKASTELSADLSLIHI